MSRKFNRNIGLFLSMALLVFMLFSTTLFAAGSENGKVHQIHLKGMQVQSEQKGNIPQGLSKTGYQVGEEGAYVVVFTGPIEEPMKTQTTNKGAKLVEYIPEFSFLALMTPEVAAKVEKLSCVKKVMVYQPAYKINPSLKDEFGNVKTTEEVTVRILTFGDASILDNEIINAHGKNLAMEKVR